MQIITSLKRLLLLMASTLWLTNASAEQPVTTWIYYENAPFIESEVGGLAYDFVDLLNRHGEGQFQFNLEVIPRVRLNQFLSKKQQGVVLFVNPVWMDPGPEKKHLWTEPLMHDRNEIISVQTRPVDYSGPESLFGLLFGTIRGHKYNKFEEAFSKEQIFRYDVKDEKQVYRLLLAGRIDITTQPRSMALAIARQMGITEQIYFSPTPLFAFDRSLLVTKELPEVHQFLNQLIPTLQQDPQWLWLIDHYQFQPPKGAGTP